MGHTGPETQRRIQALLERELQREVDFENRLPALPGTLLETSHDKVASCQAARPAFVPQSGLRGLNDDEITASYYGHGTAEAQRVYIIGTEKCIKIDHRSGVFPLLGARQCLLLGRDRVGHEVLYLLSVDGVELGVLGEFWRKISLSIDGVHGVASYQAAVS